jgi:predicted anti-sigma-YlaC factor YlaD
MISCRELTELVTEYAEGRMAFLDRVRFQIHLGSCRGCRRFVRQMRATARALGRLPPPELPAGLRDELLRRFDGWRRMGGV